MSSSTPDGRAPRRWGVRRWLLVVVAVVLAAGAQWAVVVGSPPKVDPSGVDGLTIPLLEIDPDDFVDDVTNEWLPLRVGARWVRSGEVDGQPVVETTSVLAARQEVAGVFATQVRTQAVVDGVEQPPVVRLYAQDRVGNVWLLGAQGWTLDDEEAAGAGAGLAMPADPRRGDGWVRVIRAGAVTERVRVGEGGATVLTEAGRFEDVRHFRETLLGAEAEATSVDVKVDVDVARGVGEVLRTWGQGNQLELVSHLPGE